MVFITQSPLRPNVIDGRKQKSFSSKFKKKRRGYVVFRQSWRVPKDSTIQTDRHKDPIPSLYLSNETRSSPSQVSLLNTQLYRLFEMKHTSPKQHTSRNEHVVKACHSLQRQTGASLVSETGLSLLLLTSSHLTSFSFKLFFSRAWISN
jgi:hypothetical protein